MANSILWKALNSGIKNDNKGERLEEEELHELNQFLDSIFDNDSMDKSEIADLQDTIQSEIKDLEFERKTNKKYTHESH